MYAWWAFLSVGSLLFRGVSLCVALGARLRLKLNIESPTEYLAVRYSLAAQQWTAWSGVILKVFDVGAKWVALGMLLHGFTSLPLSTGILLSGGISLLYVTIGGLWTDLYTNFAQFAVQIFSGFNLFFVVVGHLGVVGSIFRIWDWLPESHSRLFNGPFTPLFLVGGCN